MRATLVIGDWIIKDSAGLYYVREKEFPVLYGIKMLPGQEPAYVFDQYGVAIKDGLAHILWEEIPDFILDLSLLHRQWKHTMAPDPTE